MARLSTDVSAVDADQRDFEPLPAGSYVAKIVESDLVDAKSGNGQYLKMTFEVTDGPHAGRKFWDQANIVHQNPTTQSIGQQRLKAICDAIGHTGHVEDSEELHEQPMLVRLAIEQKDANYAPKNALKSVKAAEGLPPASKGKPSSTGNGTINAAPKAAGRPWGNRQVASPQ